MPKLVEHARRREELVRVVWDIISRDGIAAVTVRKVAEQAGVSVGGLRHYFDSQQGLLHFAAQAMADRVGARIAAHLRGSLPGAERARSILEELLPLDVDRRVEADVWLDGLLRSRVDASMGELRERGRAGTRHVCRLATAFRTGTLPPEHIGAELGDPHLERQAARLHVFMDGLTLHAAMYPHTFPADEVCTVLRNELDALFPTAAASPTRSR